MFAYNCVVNIFPNLFIDFKVCLLNTGILLFYVIFLSIFRKTLNKQFSIPA